MKAHGAYILARYSTDRQNPDSIEVQVDKCAEWCAAQSIPVLDIFADEGVSGMKDERPEYNRMMRQLRAGGADTVVIYDQSRMFRKMTAWFAFRDQLEKMGVRVISVTQPTIGGDLRDPTNFLTEGSMALFNQIWALQTRQKVCEKMRFMAKNGMHTGGKPALGYTVEDGRLVICDDEAEIVRGIFKDYAEGKSYREIIARLNTEGKKTKNGNRFGTNSLHDLLKNEKYIGVLTYGKVEKRPDGSRNSHSTAQEMLRIEDALPTIIDRETWDKVQERLKKNKREQSGRPPEARDYPLKGKVFCGECKSSMSVACSTVRGSKYYYYSCGSKKRKKDCDNTPIRVDELEQYVADAVREFMGKPGKLTGLMTILREERAKLQGSAANKLNKMIAQRNEIDRQLNIAIDAVMNGLNSPTLAQRIKSLEEEKAKIEHDMLKLKASVSGSGVSEERLKELMPAILNSDSVFSIVIRVDIYKDRITIWTILDADPNGDFDFSEDNDGLIITVGDGPPAPRQNNTIRSSADARSVRLTDGVVFPLQIEPASLGLDLVLYR